MNAGREALNLQKRNMMGYGIKKLQIGCVVEDDKVGTDLLEEAITAFEDFVQSVDVAAFNKI
uniref:Translation elongation factor EF1B beta/delta subunit guanine nucleotide exchange domain-containing protein n=1 Tax=Cynoglossus semilaevis TaxID=244447 RepID=A0A3P8V5R4_CYNSE